MNVLSERELEITELITLGHSESEIGAKLFISTNTVHNHAYNIRKKLNCRCAVDVARKYILSLENPKRYFASLGFLMIQIFIISNCMTIDLRKSRRIGRRVNKTYIKC